MWDSWVEIENNIHNYVLFMKRMIVVFSSTKLAMSTGMFLGWTNQSLTLLRFYVFSAFSWLQSKTSPLDATKSETLCL